MNNPADYLVTSDQSILSAMTQIELNGSRIVFVIEPTERHKLVGALSDGDIRRYILKGHSLSEATVNAMNKNPISAYIGQNSDVELEQLLLERGINIIPLLNDSGAVEHVFLKGDSDLKQTKPILNIPVVIMAGGKGTRLAPYTNVLPKPLIPVADKTIIEHIMDRFLEYGCSHFEMIVNYRKNLIKAFFGEDNNTYDVDFVEENKFQGTGGGLSLIKDKINETFFMTNCDILVKGDYEKLLNFHQENEHILTMVGAEMSMTVPYGTVLSDSSGKVSKLEEKPSFSFVSNTGLYIIEPRFLDYIPEDTFIHITDVIDNCINAGESVGVYNIGEKDWLDMGQHEGLDEMTKQLKGL